MVKPKSNTMLFSKLALMLVVMVDMMGQGLFFPILDTLMMEPSVGFLPANTPVATRQFNYGLVMSAFFFSWFLGSVYISRLSDSIGRKKGLLICLTGSLLGYVLTIPALIFNSFWLLVIGRIITGFTAGNKPIAQAAMVDFSHDEAEKTKNLAFIVSGISFGLVIGPLLGGVLSDKSLLGHFASLRLPIYAAMCLTLGTIGMIVTFFHDARTERVPLRIKPQAIFLLLWQVTKRKIVMRISLVFFWFMLTMNTFYIFMDNYLTSRFQLSTPGTSLATLIFGVSLAFSSAYLAPRVSKHFSLQKIIIGALTTMAIAIVLFIMTSSLIITFLGIVLFGLAFSIGYPILLSIFSASVDESEQGWVMGVTTALFTIACGLTSIIGGKLMGEGIRYPFFVAICSSMLAIALIVILWQTPKMLQLTQKPAS